MFKISTHIYNELKGSNIEVKKIEPEKRVKILDSIVKKYMILIGGVFGYGKNLFNMRH